MTEEREQRLAQLRSEIEVRLRPVCAQWPPEMFEEMVRGLAALTLKYDTRPIEPLYDPGPTDLLVAEMKDLADRNAELRKKL